MYVETFNHNVAVPADLLQRLNPPLDPKVQKAIDLHAAKALNVCRVSRAKEVDAAVDTLFAEIQQLPWFNGRPLATRIHLRVRAVQRSLLGG